MLSFILDLSKLGYGFIRFPLLLANLWVPNPRETIKFLVEIAKLTSRYIKKQIN